MLPLSINNGWTDHNADCCVSTVDENITTATNLVNFGPVPLRSYGAFAWVMTASRLQCTVRWFLNVIR